MKNKEKETITQRKSNKSVKTAVLLFGAVLLTTSLLGGTLAKYTGTIGEASDTARVAKWNVGEKFASFDLFADSYVGAPSNNEGTWNQNNNVNTVQSKDAGTNVIAPGTKGTAVIQLDKSTVTASVDEVAYTYNFTFGDEDLNVNSNGQLFEKIPFYRNGTERVAASAVDETGADDITTSKKGWNVIEGKYPDPLTGPQNVYRTWLPLRFKATRGDGTVLYNGIDPSSSSIPEGDVQVKGLRDALLDITKSKSEVFYPGMSDTQINEAIFRSSVTIEWEWPFEQTGMDKYDTMVGENATQSGNMVPNFVLKIAAQKTQVD